MLNNLVGYLAVVLMVMCILMVVCFVAAAFFPTEIANAQAVLAPLQDALQIIPTPVQ